MGKKKSNFPWQMVFNVIMVFLFAIGLLLLPQFINDYDSKMDTHNLKSYHTYECDGTYTVRCATALITDGGTWLKDCEDGSEYVCQTIKEI